MSQLILFKWNPCHSFVLCCARACVYVYYWWAVARYNNNNKIKVKRSDPDRRRRRPTVIVYGLRVCPPEWPACCRGCVRTRTRTHGRTRVGTLSRAAHLRRDKSRVQQYAFGGDNKRPADVSVRLSPAPVSDTRSRGNDCGGGGGGVACKTLQSVSRCLDRPRDENVTVVGVENRDGSAGQRELPDHGKVPRGRFA